MIKVILLLLLFVRIASAWEISSDEIIAQEFGLNDLKDAAKEASVAPSNELILELARGLRKTAMPSIYSNARTSEIHQLLQETLLSIPGHAQYIADEVERHRKEEEHLPRANQTSYDRMREVLIGETLIHLPSPETIQVLGDYLFDERDPAPEILFLPANSFMACVALSEIGLRDSPVASRPGIHNWREEQVKQKVWYEKIRAGNLPFSFVGQKVEYRFKPDGTWETLAMNNPPDDGPRPTKPINTNEQRPTKKQNPALASQELKPLGNSLPWIVGVTIFLIGGATWVAVRKGSHS